MAVSAQLVNLSAKAELKLVEAVASSMPSGQVRVCVCARARLSSRLSESNQSDDCSVVPNTRI